MERHFHRVVSAWVAVDLVQKLTPNAIYHTLCTILGVGALVTLLVIFEKRTFALRWCIGKVCKR